MKEKIERLSAQGTYRNSRVVDIGGVPYTARDILVTAPLIAGLNVYLVGGTGEGKTQLANDLRSLFGKESTCYEEGRPDFELSQLLKQLNLKRIQTAATDKELVELTENVRKALYYVDELNRCPPLIMNYFFNFFDGKLVHQGEVFRLGKNGYAVGYASGNIGDGAYVGISDTDRALRDRMHMIVKLDDPNFCTTEEDDGMIFESKKDPRAVLSASEGNCLEDILALHEEFKKRQTPALLPALGVYFHKGLDYLERTKRHSKRALDQNWPNAKGIREDTDESKMMPLSKRAVLASIGLSQALEMIAEARGKEVKNSGALFLDTLKLTVPHSGVLAPQYIQNEKDGDVYVAFDDVMASTKRDINEKMSDLEVAVSFAHLGEKELSALDRIAPLGRESRWSPVRRYIESLAERAPEERKTVLKDIRDGYKEAK